MTEIMQRHGMADPPVSSKLEDLLSGRVSARWHCTQGALTTFPMHVKNEPSVLGRAWRTRLSSEFLYNQSEILILLILIALLLTAGETGYRIGRRTQAKASEATKSHINIVQGTILGLLSLLLSFTLAMAVSRFETRKQLVVEEANSIGTASLRARLLQEPSRAQVIDMLRLYVDTRLETTETGQDEGRSKALQERAAQLQDQLWVLGVDAARKDEHSITAGLFIQALNDVFDEREKRTIALSNHVPESVVILLIIGAVLGASTVGFTCGLAGSRRTALQWALSLLIVLVIFVILDLDRPRLGLIRINQKSMIDLNDSLHNP